MTALDHPTTAIAAGTRTVATVARMVAGLRNLVRVLRNRGHVKGLDQLSDHELADIGLMRTDIAVALRSPIGVDPTRRLHDFARERAAIEGGARRVC